MIANDVKYGPSDIIQNGVSGVLTQDGQVDQLATAMRQLLADPKQLDEYRQAAYANVQRYSEDAVFAKWQELLDYFDQQTARTAQPIATALD